MINHIDKKSTYELDYYAEESIKALLLYRKIVKVDDNTLYLDNGVELIVCPNEGCGGCSAGWYSLVELNNCDNVITNVEFCCDDDTADYYDDTSYKIFVFAENKKIKILQVDGSDGNGYYGSGYSIIVKEKKVD